MDEIPVINAPLQKHLLICNGKACSEKGSDEVLSKLKELLSEEEMLYSKANRGGTVKVGRCSCLGLCQVAPSICVYPSGHWYSEMKEERLHQFVQGDLKNQNPTEDWISKKVPKI